MPTTGNHNQDNMSSEESTLPRNNVEFESSATEVTIAEQPDIVSPEGTSATEVTIAEQPDIVSQEDTSATEVTNAEQPDIVSPEDTSAVETSNSGGDMTVENSVADVSEISASDDAPIHSDVPVDIGEIQKQQQQYFEEAISFQSADHQSEIDRDNVVSEADMDISNVESDPNSLGLQQPTHPDSVVLHHHPPQSGDDAAEQTTSHMLHSTHTDETMEVDPGQAVNLNPEATSEQVDSDRVSPETYKASSEQPADVFHKYVNEYPEYPQDDSAVESAITPAPEENIVPSSPHESTSSHDQATALDQPECFIEGTSEVMEGSSEPTSQYLDGSMENTGPGQVPEMADSEQFIDNVSSNHPSDGVDQNVSSAQSEEESSGTPVEVGVENQAVAESVSEGLEEEAAPVADPTINENVTSSEWSGELDRTGLTDETDNARMADDINVGEKTCQNDNVTPSGTALMTNILEDEVNPPQQAAGVETSLKPTNSFSQSSSNSFQSAFAAFASGVSTNDSTPQKITQEPQIQLPVEEEQSASSQTVDSSSADSNVAPVVQEPKKVSKLPMPGEQDMNQTNTTPDQGFQNQVMEPEPASEMTSESSVASDAVYFIQMADASGEVVTSIIDPNDIASYTDSVVYKQCMGADGQIETTIVSSGGMMYPDEQAQQTPVEAAAPEPQQEMEQQVIYAHDLNGKLTPIDSSQSATDVAPPGKQFVYMQDSSGRIIRTIMDANQTMVPGQQVYYTQSEDGRIITSVMDNESADQSATTAATSSTDYQQKQQQQVHDLATQGEQESQQRLIQQQAVGDGTTRSGSGPEFAAIDNSGLSGLSMLAELTAGQAPVDLKGSSSTENSCQDADMDQFRPVAMITRRVGEEGGGSSLEAVNSEMAGLKVAQGTQSGDGPTESMLAKLTTQITAGSTLPSVSRDNLFVQWQNLDAMCWMDVVLIMLVYSPSLQPLVNMEPSHELASTLLITLLKANRQAQVLLQNLLKRSEAANSLQNGSGITTTAVKEARTSRLVGKENMDEIGKAINVLYAMREQIWQALQPRLQCERGKHNSPVLVLPMLVREKPVIKQMFTMKFRYVFKCDKCGYSQDDTHSKILPTIPAVPHNFNMKDPCFVRNCFECKAPNQRMYMRFEGLQDFVQMHFVKGLPHNRFDELSFDHNGDHYEVTAVVHYKNNPDHFIAWVRNAPGNYWMECDDLKSVITRYQAVKPPIPPSQVHMVMWERRLTPQHIQVMRDTEDTRILSSLVLTVQQPGGGGQDAATKTSTLGSTPGAVQGTASSVLSGLINQSQGTPANFSPYTPRGRGSRGGRGGRGRGRPNVVNTSIGGVTTLKRGINSQMITPTLAGTPTATTRPAGSPQIIRLPLSALQGMGAQLRGATPGAAPSPQRIVLMGANNASQASGTSTSTTPAIPQQKKVVVLRSQDGSASLNQLSATQLLQLLQRSGAISSANTRITTTISKPSSDGTSQQQTITLTPSAPANAATTPSAVPEQTIASTATISGQTDNIETMTSLAQTEPLGRMVTNSTTESLPITSITTEPSGDTSIAPVTDTPMDVDPSPAISDETQTSVATTAVSQMDDSEQSSQTPVGLTEAPSTIAAATATPISALSSSLSPETGVSTDSQSKSVLTLNSNTLKALARSGQGDGNRYLQIPNPKGGPNIMTRLIVRGDKMMLVPVEKSAVPSESTPIPATAAAPTVTNVTSPLSNVRAPSSLLSAALQSSTLISPSSLSNTSTTSSTGSAPATRYITIPANHGAGGKRTIQLISVPKGSTAAGGTQSGSTSTRTLILGQPSSSGTTSAVTSATQQLIKQTEDGSTVLSSVSGEISTQTPLHGATTVSLLRDMTGAKSTSTLEDRTQGISILSPASGQTAIRTQEGFKYILPGSNTQQMAAIQTVSGAQLGSKAFTALSSSGTIIGGQLTTVNTDMTPSPVESVDAGVQSLYPELDAISPTLLPSSRSRGGRGGRGSRGGRGRSSSAKNPRGGRGGRQSQVILSQQQQQIQLSGRQGATVSMLPADFHGIGGQIIQTSTESVDGAPVVSIPDFSNAAMSMQSEPQQQQQQQLAVTESGLITTANSVDLLCPPPTESVSLLSSASGQEGLTLSEPMANQGPRVITQPIPSIKANHGFDILTQGILGAQQAPTIGTTRKTGISLLTGKTVTSPPLLASSPPTSSLSSSLLTSDVTRMQQSLAMGQSVSQNEIDTLIKAAQGAAKPPKPGQVADETTPNVVTTEQPAENREENQIETVKTTTLAEEQSGFNVDDFLTGVKSDENVEARELDKSQEQNDEHETMDTSESGDKQRVFSVDESQVSAAERYRMPTELFQPDEESPEKPVRSDSISRHISGSNILGEDLPSKLFNDQDVSSQDEEMKSPVAQHMQISQHQMPLNSPEKEVLNSPTSMTSPGVPRDSEVEENNVSNDEMNQMASPSSNVGLEEKRVGEGREVTENLMVSPPRGKNKQSGGRRKKRRSSSKHSFSESDEFVSEVAGSSPPTSQDAMIISSPVKADEEAILQKERREVLGVGGFTSDILSESSDFEKQVEDVNDEKEGDEERVQQIAVPVNEELERLPCVTEQKEEVIESKVGLDSENVIDLKDDLGIEKDDGKENASPITVKKQKSPRRKRVATPLPKAFIVNKKQKADWSSEIVRKSANIFCYKLLSRTRNTQNSRRHSSLGPVALSFTGFPVQYSNVTKKKDDFHELLTCVVKRRRARALDRPKVDPSKEPTVIPLVPEEDADPACTFGGSVVTIPETGEVFTGVVVRKRREIADWNMGAFDEEVDNIAGDKWEDKETMREYMETMWTSMCMELKFSDFFEKSEYDGGAIVDSCDEEDEEDEEEDDEYEGGEEEEENDVCSQSLDKIEKSAILTEGLKVEEGEDFMPGVNVNGDSETTLRSNQGGEKHKMDVDEVEEESDWKRLRLSDDDGNFPCSTTTPSDPDTQPNSHVVPKENNVSSSTNIANKISTLSSSPSVTPITSTSCNGFAQSECSSSSNVSTLPFAHLVTPSSSSSPSLTPSTSTKSLSSPTISSSSSSAAAIPSSSSATPSVSSSTKSSSSSKKNSKTSTSSTTTPLFVSPTRRSSRTPVPSAKVRDSLEDGAGVSLPMKILSKNNRRASVVSSDDDMSGSGYSSDEVAIKKKTKKFHNIMS